MSIGRARASVTGIFFLNGAVFGSWYARVPAIQDDLSLSTGELGLALLGAPVGLLAAQPLAGAAVARRGSRPLVAAAPLYLAAVVLPAVAVDAVTLFMALLVVGAANGVLDIAMNAQGVAVERAGGRRIFNSLHAAFSFGVLIGAAAAAVVASAGVDPLPHLAATAVVGALAAAALVPGLLRDEGRPEAPGFARPSRRLAALGAVAFCALLAEGAVFDWSGVYLTDEAGAAAGVAPLGLAAFSLAMAAGRLAGDRVADLTGTAGAVRAGALVAAAGIGIALAWPEPGVAIVGFAVMGVGLSVVFPLTLLASAGHAPIAAPGLAAVSTAGYVGFLAGPPAIGLAGDAVGLRGALVLLPALCVLAAAVTARAPDE